MQETITTPPEGGENTKAAANIGSDVFTTLTAEQQEESKEIQSLPNIIICRRYYTDYQNDMSTLESKFPEILKNVIYTHNPNEVIDHLKSDQKNIIFVGQYFDYNMTGTQLADMIQEKGLDTQVSLITSINVPYHQRSNCDYFYQISQSQNQSDGVNVIVKHLKNMIKIPNKKEILSQKELLDKKLELLHTLLLPSGIPEKISKELILYTESFETFRQSVEGCLDAFEKKYIDALRIFRDELLKE